MTATDVQGRTTFFSEGPRIRKRYEAIRKESPRMQMLR